MKLNILIEGQAGQGPNILAKVIGNVLTKNGYFVFINREYGSFIRGGKNCNQLTISDKMVMSNDSKVDIVVSLKSESEWKGRDVLLIQKEGEDNMYFAGYVLKMLGIEIKALEEELKKLKNFDENLKHAKKGFSESQEKYKFAKLKNEIKLVNGAETAAEGAIKSGMDVYYAYPMTPATSMMMELAGKQTENNHLVLELENEIAVINAALGSAITGAKAMVGTSGGGFDLMTEALTLSGIAEIPMVVYLAQRPGPATGVATYTSQGDLKVARGFGHGEFSRIVSAAGDPKEAEELTSQSFYFSQKYGVPYLILTDKHLAESLYSVTEKAKIMKSEKLTVFKRYNSYETDENGAATEDIGIIKKNVDRRLAKQKKIEEELEKFEMFRIFGKKESKNIVLFWGSTKGAILDAIEGIDVKAIQIIYLDPFSVKIKDLIKDAKKLIVVENNATSPLSDLIAEKTGIFVKEKILRYDGQPFFSDELNEEIKRRIK